MAREVEKQFFAINIQGNIPVKQIQNDRREFRTGLGNGPELAREGAVSDEDLGSWVERLRHTGPHFPIGAVPCMSSPTCANDLLRPLPPRRTGDRVGIRKRFVSHHLDQIAEGKIDIIEVESPLGSEHRLHSRSSVLGPSGIRDL